MSTFGDLFKYRNDIDYPFDRRIEFIKCELLKDFDHFKYFSLQKKNR